MNAHNQQVIDFRGNIIPLVNLTEIFEMPEQSGESDGYQSVVIVRKGEKLAGLVVDSFIGQQEIVLKSLGNYLTECICDFWCNDSWKWTSCTHCRLQRID